MFFKNLIRFFLFIFFLLNIGQSSAEYLLVKKIEGEIIAPSIQEYEIAIDIVMQWKFPLYLSDIERIRSLDEQNLKFLCENEQAFIEKKLTEAGLDLKLIFIPTIFYEVYILTDSVLSNELKQKEAKEYETIEVPDFLEDGAIILDYFIASVRSCNYNDHFYVDKNFYYKVNNLLLSYSKENSFIFANAFLTRIKQAVKDYEDPEIEQEDITKYILENLKLKFTSLQKVLDFEFIEKNNGFFSVYRGTYGYENLLDMLKVECESMAVGLCGYGLSYGNSIFAGIFTDRGASAFTYIFDSNFAKRERGEHVKSIGYFLFISKLDHVKEFIKNGINSRLFVSPVNTINGLIAKGELFHSRVLDVVSEDESIICNSRMDFHDYLKQHAFIIENNSNLSNRTILGLNTRESLEEINLPYRLFRNLERASRRRFFCAPIKTRVL